MKANLGAAVRFPDPETRRPRLLAGSIVVILLVFGSRWVSYLGVGPIFISDLLVALALVGLIVSTIARRQVVSRPGPDLLTPVVVVLLSYLMLRFLWGWQLGFTPVRDFAPYAYVVVALLAYHSTLSANEATLQNTWKWVWRGLVAHLIWFATVSFLPSVLDFLPILEPTQNLRVFSKRPDVDTALAGVLSALTILRLLTGQRRRGTLVILFTVSWATIAATESRAGLIAAVLVNVMTVVILFRAQILSKNGRTGIILSALAVPIMVALVLPRLEIGDRLAGGLGVANSSVAAAGAAGTTNARVNAWGALTEYTVEEPKRAIFGVGFGPDVLSDSNASLALIGTNVVDEARPRSPHNFWVGSFARLGAVGLALVLLLVYAAVKSSSAYFRSVRGESVSACFPMALFSVSLIVGFLVVASLGVVLESPFGAIPFYWSVGCVMALSRRSGERGHEAADSTHVIVVPSRSRADGLGETQNRSQGD